MTAPAVFVPSPLTLGLLARSSDVHRQALARAARPDYPAWVAHVQPAAGCTRPIRLAGESYTVRRTGADTAQILSTMDTAGMPDGVIYKPCGNRREAVCPSCSARYKRDAYHIVRAGLVGGKGVPEHVAQHPAVFPTFTAPSFGQVHTRVVKRHTCGSRSRCDCRPEPCHPRREVVPCPHGTPLVCFARHEGDDSRLGTPMCMDCYDYPGHVVWNLQAGELWRRTTIAINRYIRRLARQRGIPEHRVYYPDKDGNSRSRLVPAWRLSFGKAAEMQRRAVIHFHAIIRLDGNNPADPTAILPPPAELDAQDLVDAVAYAVRTVAFVTGSHRARPVGWLTGWGEQVHTKVITVAADGEVTDGMVAAYLAKYATKSTEVTGHVSGRLTAETVHLYADPDGTHTERLVEACWTLGHAGCVEGPACPDPCQHHTCADIHDPGRVWRRLRRWAHMLGFGGHFLTKSRRYSVTFAILRQQRVVFRRTDATGPDTSDQQPPQKDTTLVVNFLQFVGAGWHTTADALLANTSAALAREHQTLALAEIAAMAV